MTKKAPPSAASAREAKPGRRRSPTGAKKTPWPLNDAKAHLSELVRRVKTDGPQTVTVHGREEVVVVAAADFRRLSGEKTGAALIEALQSCPHDDVDIAPERHAAPIRNVKL